MGRGVDRAAAVGLALRLPWCLLSLLVLAVPTALLTSGDEAAVVAVAGGFLLSGGLLFLRPTEVVVARAVFRLRRPTAEERARLDHAWHAVARAAEVDGSSYRLWVERSHRVNAYAVAGRTVAVTRWAVAALPPRQLEAVLAHELGHHLGGHPWTLLLMCWYAVPARLALWVVALGLRIVSWVWWLVLTVSAMSLILWVVTRLLAVVAGLAVVLLFRDIGFAPGIEPVILLAAGPSLLLPWLSRLGEIYADRAAADLGYGPALIEVLQGWIAEGQDVARARRGWGPNVFAHHPSCSTRIRRLRRHLVRQAP